MSEHAHIQGCAFQTGDMNWQEMRGMPAGVEVKILRMDVRSGSKTMLVKLPPGGQIFAHRHDVVIQHYVVEGEYVTKGQRFGVGTYRMIPQGSDVPTIDSAQGVTFLLVSDPVGVT